MRVWVFGDYIDTDQMISGKHLSVRDPAELTRYLFEKVRPEFSAAVKPGDIIKAGVNFGCGSSRENVASAFIAAGISCIIAEGFSRTFFRNCINLGLLLIKIPPGSYIEEGDEIKVDLENVKVINFTRVVEYQSEPLPEFLIGIVKSGGLIPYTKKRMRGVCNAPVDKNN